MGHGVSGGLGAGVPDRKPLGIVAILAVWFEGSSWHGLDNLALPIGTYFLLAALSDALFADLLIHTVVTMGLAGLAALLSSRARLLAGTLWMGSNAYFPIRCGLRRASDLGVVRAIRPRAWLGSRCLGGIGGAERAPVRRQYAVAAFGSDWLAPGSGRRRPSGRAAPAEKLARPAHARHSGLAPRWRHSWRWSWPFPAASHLSHPLRR